MSLLSAIFTAAVGAAEPCVQFITPKIVRVRWNPESSFPGNATGACVYTSGNVEVRSQSGESSSSIESDQLRVEFSGSSISFLKTSDAGDRLLLSTAPDGAFSCDTVVTERIVYDNNSARMEETANGKVTVKDILRRDTTGLKRRFKVSFLTSADEGLYGLGAHMEDYMNLTGKTLYLTQHNLKAFVPMLVSTGGYGLLFDAGCSMKFGSTPLPGDSSLFKTSMQMEAAKELDFYFIMGDGAEEVTEGYRYLTGAVPLMPLHLFGYIQSKERYVSSADIVNTVKEYRRRHVPLDMVVQDWNYWPQGWGYMKMDRRHYPDPKALADSVHALNARLMVSIWANPQYCPQADDFKSRGFMLEHSVYDAFNPAARDLYWEYADREFFSNGFDAWWCDSSEPLDGDWNRMPEPENGSPYGWDDHERRWHLNDAVLSEALGPERACLYALYHAKGIHDHQRAASHSKRVVNLTRSTAAGMQRYGTIVWNGDTYASWESFRRQIPAGLNFLATGQPYWTVDVGCFFTASDDRWFRKGVFPAGVADDAFREFYTRMFQWASFLPVLRSHGTDTPREIWQFGEPGTPFYDAILRMIRLRYRMVPYIYGMAARQTEGGYSMARPLAFDFPADRRVYDIKDQYLFGDVMVCPVTQPGAVSRSVFLPQHDGGWYDFRTGKHFTGGTQVDAPAPLDDIPLFVKAGSIIPLAEEMEYTAEKSWDCLTLKVYPGKDAQFMLYEDGGDSYDYLEGKYTRITLSWDDTRKTLTVGDRTGAFDGMPRRRIFIITLPDGSSKQLKYTGKARSLKFT